MDAYEIVEPLDGCGRGRLLRVPLRAFRHDRTRRPGVRHSLASILAIAMAATPAGAPSVAAIGEYATDCAT